MALQQIYTITNFTSSIPSGRWGSDALSMMGQRLSTCTVYGEDVTSPVSLDAKKKRLRVVRVRSSSDVDQYFYPPLPGLIVDVDAANAKMVAGEDPRIAWGSVDKREAEFRSFRKYDKVVMTDVVEILLRFFTRNTPADEPADGDLVMAIVKDTSRRQTENVIEVELRSVVSRTGTRKNLTPNVEMNENGLPVPVRFYLQPWQLRRAAPEDELACCANPTTYDRIAIRYPAYFLATVAGYDWRKVKQCYQDGLDALKAGHENIDRNQTLTYDFGGLNALKEYRDWVSNLILENLRDLTRVSVQNTRMRHAIGVEGESNAVPAGPIAAGTAPDIIRQFINWIEPLEWNAAGSTEATSDVDISTYGDGTEWAVKAFNFLFQTLHDGTEPGLATDVNVYGTGFIPKKWDDFKLRKKGKGAVMLEPAYTYTFSPNNGAGIQNDVRFQNVSALLHLRRYALDRWSYYLQQVGGRGTVAGVDLDEFRQAVIDVQNSYQMSRYLLAETMRWLAAGNNLVPNHSKIVNLPAVKRTDPLSTFDAIVNNEELAALRIAAEDRLYEKRLDLVSLRRSPFDYTRFRIDSNRKNNVNGPATAALVRDADDQWAALRGALSYSLYFGNECYASEGSLIQVVGGKQLVSAGVTVAKMGEATFHNIDYTIHQLMQSMTEQIGDFFKEATRHFDHCKHENMDDATAYGDAVVASAKYLHRYFNAMKWFYLYLNGTYTNQASVSFTFDVRSSDEVPEVLIDVGLVEESVFSEADRAFPGLVLAVDGKTQAQSFRDVLRSLGFGLEMLKKFKFADGAKAFPASPKPKLVSITTNLQALEYKLVTLPGGLAGKTDADKPSIARAAVHTYMAYLDGDEFKWVDSLDKLKIALLKLHAYVTVDYYAGRDAAVAAAG